MAHIKVVRESEVSMTINNEKPVFPPNCLDVEAIPRVAEEFVLRSNIYTAARVIHVPKHRYEKDSKEGYTIIVPLEDTF
jgi:hypothetical protein